MEAAGVPYAVIRGAALAVRGLPRMTRDIDVTVMVDDARSAIAALRANQPKHLGDFAAIVGSGRADLAKAERLLASMHPEMLRTWKRRVSEARTPRSAPRRPPARKR